MTSISFTGRTRILAVIADPVSQARSPALVNAALHQRGRLGEFVLVPMHVRAKGLTNVIAALRGVENFTGAIISMPHKSSIVALLDELTPDAQVVGAVNVVRRSADGRLRGTMLDGEGFVAGLRSAGHEVKGMSCLLVGAGGAAAAIAFALARHGCAALTIRNRTVARATSLAARVRQASSSVDVQVAADERGSYDMLINATSVGMNDDGEMPVPAAVIERSGLVAECVVAPEVTPLLRLARTIGRPIHTGVPMLTAQIDLMLRFMGVE